jgi:hypothetical protein
MQVFLTWTCCDDASHVMLSVGDDVGAGMSNWVDGGESPWAGYI